MIITATSIAGRTISWNPQQFICTIKDKSKDTKDEKPSKVLSVFTHYNSKELNISVAEADRIIKILETLEIVEDTKSE